MTADKTTKNPPAEITALLPVVAAIDHLTRAGKYTPANLRGVMAAWRKKRDADERKILSAPTDDAAFEILDDIESEGRQ